MNELILPPEPRRSNSESRAKETIEIVVEPRERRSGESRRSPVSALLGAVAVIGAGVYVSQLAQSAMTKQAAPAVTKQAAAPVAAEAPAPLKEAEAPAPAKAAETPAPAREAEAGLTEAQRQIAALQSEVRDLRAKLESVEKRQPDAAPQAPEAARASAPPAPPAPQAAPPPRAAIAEPPAPVQRVAPTPAPARLVPGYRLREAFRSNALVESRRGVIDVQPGDMLPGAGRVLAIEKRAGRWVVATESGDIVGDAARLQPRPPAPAPRRRPVYREQYGYEPDPMAPMYVPF